MNVAIYLESHHHLLDFAEHITGGVMSANNILFSLSLIAFATACMGENYNSALTSR